MSDPGRRRTLVILACILIAAGLALTIGLILSAVHDRAQAAKIVAAESGLSSAIPADTMPAPASRPDAFADSTTPSPSAAQLRVRDAWSGRAFGLGAGVLAILLGGCMLRFGRPSDLHYWSSIAALSLATVLTGAYWYHPAQPQASDRAKAISKFIGGWICTSDSDMPEKDMEVLGTTDVLARTYQRGEDGVELVVVFSLGNRRAAHAPEQCLSAQGRELQEMAPDSFTTADGRTINARRLIAIDGARTTAFLYWYKAGDLNTSSIVRESIHSLFASLLFQRNTRVALIRLATVLRPGEERPAAVARLRDFASDAFPELEEKLR